MWIFDTLDLLPRPTLRGTAPYLGMLAVYLLFSDLQVSAAAVHVSPLGLAVFASLLLTLGRNLPATFGKGRATGAPLAVAFPALLILPLALAGVFVADPLWIQKGWLAGWIIYALIFLWVVNFGEDEDLDLLPSRWASSKEPLSRSVLMIHGLRHGAELAIASWLMLHRPEIDWIVFVSLGRLAGFYLAEWAIVLFILAHDDG